MLDNLKIATLNESAAASVQNLEADLGEQIMAYEVGAKFAELTPEQVEKVESLEKELGVTLLVYKE